MICKKRHCALIAISTLLSALDVRAGRRTLSPSAYRKTRNQVRTNALSRIDELPVLSASVAFVDGGAEDGFDIFLIEFLGLHQLVGQPI